MKELETSMRSWKPRRVSARIEAELFGAAEAGTSAVAAAPLSGSLTRGWPALPWLAPATAAVLLLALLRSQTGSPQVSMMETEMLTAALSNQTAAAWLPGSFAAEQNNIPAQRFEWTNRAGSTSSTPSFSGERAND